MDDSFRKFYQGRLKQIFLYITYNCNYSCRHCLIGDRSKISYSKGDIYRILDTTKKSGCSKVTLIGGEPTLHPNILEIIDYAKKLDLTVVLDTNGSFPSKLWSEPQFCNIDAICFSVDGHIDSIHDNVRGKGSYANLLKQIQYAKDNHRKVKFTHTVTRSNVDHILDMILLANDLEIDEFNVHVATVNGRAKYIDDPNIISPDSWHATYKNIQAFVKEKELKDNLFLRIPPRYCTYEELANNYSDHICLKQITDRMLILPEDQSKGDRGGPLYLCGLLIGEKKRLGENIQGDFVFKVNEDAESRYYESIPNIDGIQVCPIIFQDSQNLNHLKNNNLIPLCISYKPDLHRVGEK